MSERPDPSVRSLIASCGPAGDERVARPSVRSLISRAGVGRFSDGCICRPLVRDRGVRNGGDDGTHLTREAHQLFATQHGVAGVDQLVAAGLSARRIKRLEADGSLIRVLRGAYRTPSVELDELGRSRRSAWHGRP